MANSYELVLVSSESNEPEETEAVVEAVVLCCRERGAAVVSSHARFAIEIATSVAERKPLEHLDVSFDPAWDPRHCTEAISMYQIPSNEELESCAGEISARVTLTAPDAYEQEEADYPARLQQALFDTTKTGCLIVVTPSAAIKSCIELMGAQLVDEEIPVFSMWTILHDHHQAVNSFSVSDYEALGTFVRSRQVPEQLPPLPRQPEVVAPLQSDLFLDSLPITTSQVMSDSGSSDAVVYSRVLASEESAEISAPHVAPFGIPPLGGENLPNPAQMQPDGLPHVGSGPPQLPGVLPFMPSQPPQESYETVQFAPPQLPGVLPFMPSQPPQESYETVQFAPPQLPGVLPFMPSQPPQESPEAVQAPPQLDESARLEPQKDAAAFSPPQFHPSSQPEPVHEEPVTERALESEQKLEETLAFGQSAASPSMQLTFPSILLEEKKVNEEITAIGDSVISDFSALLNSKVYPGRGFNPLEQAATMISKELRKMEAHFARAMDDFRKEVVSTEGVSLAPREEIEALLKELHEVSTLQQEVEATLSQVTERIVPTVTALKGRVAAAVAQQEELKLSIRNAIQEKQDLAMPLQVVQVVKDEHGQYRAKVKSRKAYPVWGFVAVHRNGEEFDCSRSSTDFNRVKEFSLSEFVTVPPEGPFEVMVKHYLDKVLISNALKFE